MTNQANSSRWDHPTLKNHMARLPNLGGVYLFKDSADTVLYVGKAKDLKKRVSSYFRNNPADLKLNDFTHKSHALVQASSKIDHIVTKTETEALLLEAQLIRNYQPKFNVLLKTGQPYLYIFFTKPKGGGLPQVKLVRTKWNDSTYGKTGKSSGTYFGPFLEKGHARRVYNFLLSTFKIKICNQKIPQGCLHYHIGKCAGTCKGDFDKQGYLERLTLAKKSLTYGMIPSADGHKKFLQHLEEQIEKHNKNLNFEKSREFHAYHQSFSNIFSALQTNFARKEKSLTHKHIWIFLPDKQSLFLFDERSGATKKKYLFRSIKNGLLDPVSYFKRYYHNHDCPQLILTNFLIENKLAYEEFLKAWLKKTYPISIISNPQNPHLDGLVKLTTVHAEQELAKMGSLGAALKKLLKLSKEPKTVDCFDISHKQGKHMVGSCVRFLTHGTAKVDKNNIRKFKIKTVEHQDDYACLREIVSRRYKDEANLPDLVLIDGGKGQLNAVKDLFPKTDFASLAKREETVFSKQLPEGKKLNIHSIDGQFLIELRDYAHHFAISYHKWNDSALLRNTSTIS